MSKKATIGKRFTAWEREEWVARFRRGQFTQRAFAAKIGISASCLRNWLRDCPPRALSEPKASTPAFVEINAGNLGASRLHPALTVRFPGGIELEAAPGCGVEQLSAVCQVLSGL